MVTKTLPPTFVSDDEVVVETIPMSYDAYLDWYDKEAGRRGEWVAGEVIPFMTTSITHARLVMFLSALLSAYLDIRRVGEVIAQDFELRTREGAAREPDLIVVLNEHFDRYREMRLVGASDIVVDVISPDSVSRDRHDKRSEYAAAGIPEYWIVDPRPGRASIDLYVLAPAGSYAGVMPDADGRLPSRVLPGMWLSATWLTASSLPSAIQPGTRMATSAEHV